MLRFRWITFDRFKVVNLSRFYRVNFIRPYWVNFTVFSTFDKDISRQYDGLNGSRYALTVFSLFYNGILTEKDLSEFDDRTREAFLEHRRQWNLEL